jgi:hypothetical protein
MALAVKQDAQVPDCECIRILLIHRGELSPPAQHVRRAADYADAFSRDQKSA